MAHIVNILPELNTGILPLAFAFGITESFILILYLGLALSLLGNFDS